MKVPYWCPEVITGLCGRVPVNVACALEYAGTRAQGGHADWLSAGGQVKRSLRTQRDLVVKVTPTEAIYNALERP